MLRSLFYLLKTVAFWIIVFTVGKLLFIAVNFSRFNSITAREVVAVFFYSLRLDLSTIAYLIIPVFILWILQQVLKRNSINKINYILSGFLLFVVATVIVSNALLYREWNTLINVRLFMYLSSFGEALTFASIPQITVFILGTVILFFLLLLLYHFMGLRLIPYSTKKWFIKLAVIIVLSLGIVLMMRGGWQLLPVNQSSSFHSSNQLYNHVATNCVWYLASSIVEKKEQSNTFIFFEKEKAAEITRQLLSSKNNATQQLLTTQRPNVVILVLESWTANVIAALGGEPGITPQFDSLRKKGLLFTNAYASGYRTDQGIVSILSGFPAQPTTSIIFDPPKSEKLPNLNKTLLGSGYKNSSFYYGGDVNFANMGAYLLSAGFLKLTDKKEFSKEQLSAKWGAHDQFVLSKQLSDMQQMPQPFFSVLLTLSSHEPFEVPLQTPFTGSDEKDQFRKAIYYSDKCLGDYFTQARTQHWFKNTLFILVADHGHRLPIDCDMSLHLSKKITFMLYGDVLRDSLKGKTVDTLINQHDIPAVLLSQLNIPAKDFFWSGDVFNPGREKVVYYANENVLGWIVPKQKLAYSFTSKNITYNDTEIKNKDSITAINSRNAKAYLQTLFQQYLDY